MRVVASYGLRTPTFHADPAPVLAQARRDAPIHWDPELGTWVLTRWHDVAAVLRDPRFSVDRGGSIAGLGDPAAAEELAWCSGQVLRWMVFSDPPHHTRLRSAVHRYFASSAVGGMRAMVARVVADVMAEPVARGGLDVIADVAVPVPAIVTARMLGLPVEDAAQLKQWTADLFALFGAGVADAPTVTSAYRSLRACHEYFARVLEERRRRPGDDLISALYVDDAAPLDDDERIGLCATMVAGAYETTTHVVGNAVWALLRHPDQLARLRAEPALCANAVEEVFRWDGPAFSVVRRASADATIGGATIAAGDRVYCLLYAANRDPARHSAPDDFDVGRADTRHLGLGHGVHFCLGAALTRIESIAMLEALVALPALTLDGNAPDGEPRYAANLAIRGLERLPVRIAADC
ncbi:MAG TPA: cytochrome P450 [Kofleriaceae bacterium]|nr:cytochrome P450 [Kofleriaceae bacterium]